MRTSRLQALALAGLLGLTGVAAAAAAGKPCPEDSSESRAVELAKCNGGFADRQRLAQVYQQELGLSAGAAARLAEALAASQALETRRDPDDSAFEQEVRQIESEFILLLSQEPGNPRIAAEVSWFYNGGPWSSRVPAPALLDLVARSADPVRLADRLTEPGYSRAVQEILFAALAVRPEAAELWHRAAQLTYDPALKIALLEETCRRLPTGEDGRPAGPGAIVFAEELLDAQLNVGLVSQAIATFQSLAPEVRSRIEKGTTGRAEAENAGLPFPDRWRDVRRPLAAAYLLAGDLKAVAGLASRMPAPAAKAGSEVKAGETARRLLARWLHPTPEDPFELLTTALAQESDRPAAETLALARLAERERYPAIAAYALELLAQIGSETPFEPVRGVLPRVRATAEAMRGELEKLRRSSADEARADREAARTGFGPDPAAAAMGRLLRAPGTVRFAERPLPEGLAPVELEDQQIENRQKAMTAGMKLPAGFGWIRAERQGDRAAALGVSQAYDPLGEVSSGAYWVLLSADGGRTWDPPLYTGLQVNQPYVARAVSRLPLLAEGRLQVEVEVAELDPSQITFPPIALEPRRTAKGLYLDLPLELLQKDSDGDGLTDLAEERLLTDPASRDTDGDGLEDGVDPLPAVPFRREAPPSAAAKAMAVFLANTWIEDSKALIAGIGAGPLPLCCAKDGTRAGNEKTLFLIADRGLFSALEPTRRVVVLTAEEAEAAKQKFGPFYPQRLELFVFDRSGRRAYAIWSASWQGGQILLEEQPDGTWKATPTVSWVT